MEEYLKIAKAELAKLKRNETFMVRDLFKGYEWNRIKKGDRLLLGSMFLLYAKEQDNIEILEKTSSNQQKYRIK